MAWQKLRMELIEYALSVRRLMFVLLLSRISAWVMAASSALLIVCRMGSDSIFMRIVSPVTGYNIAAPRVGFRVIREPSV